MNYCPKCNIVIRGNKACCPMCQGKVTDVPPEAVVSDVAGEDAFPVIEKRVSSITFIKIVTFVFIALEISLWLANRIAGEYAPWITLVMLGVLVAWIDVLVTTYIRNNVIKVLTVETYAAIIVNVYVDYMTGRYGWALAWVVPSLLVGLGIATIITAHAVKLRPNEYITYIVYDAAVALLQLIPIRLGQNTFEIPALASIAGYMILMAALLIFRSRDLRTGLSRRFNV